MRRIALSLCALSIAACSKKTEPAADKPHPVAADVAPAPAEAKPDASAVEAKADVALAPADAAPAPVDAAPAPADGTTAKVEPGKKRGEDADAVCAAITTQSNTVREAFRKEVDAVPPEKEGPVSIDVNDAAYGGCLGEGPRTGGAWAFELVSANVDPETIKEGAEDGAAADVSVGIVWIAPDGTEQATSALLTLGFSSSSMEFERVHDFDRDGRPELVVTMTSGSPDHRDSELVVFRAGEAGSAEVVRLWKDAATITGLEDIDGDGVLDLLNGNAFQCEQGMNKLAGFAAATHVVKLDQLAANDEAAKRYYTAKCPKKVGASGIGRGEIEEVLARATCAWLWGEEPAAIEGAIAAAVKGSDYDAEVSCSWLSSGAKPPVTLP